MLVSYNFNSFNPSDLVDLKSTWSNLETTYPIKKYMSVGIWSLFNSGRWKQLNRCAILPVKYHNPENLVFQHLPVKEKIINPYKSIDCKTIEINRMRSGLKLDTLTSVYIVEIVRCVGIVL